tara:strand:- start:398 stop:994 length:597 start_codon:yes stop_codon:yes gene_type:complete
MLKDLIGTIFGKKDPMYRYIYYHSFKRFILTYLLFALGLAIIKILDAITLVRIEPSIDATAFYLISLGTILTTLATLGILISVFTILIFLAAKLLRKKTNFSQLFFAMHSILPFFLIIKLMLTLAIFFSNMVYVSIAFHWLLMASVIYFLFIIAKTSSYFTTLSLLQSIIVVFLITSGFAAALYGVYLYFTNLVASLT